MTTLAKLISNFLQNKLAPALADKFGIDPEECRKFLKDFAKSGSSGAGKTNSSRHTGYIVFRREMREQHKEELQAAIDADELDTKYKSTSGKPYKGQTFSKQLMMWDGAKWSDLSNSEKEKYNKLANSEKNVPCEQPKLTVVQLNECKGLKHRELKEKAREWGVKFLNNCKKADLEALLRECAGVESTKAPAVNLKKMTVKNLKELAVKHGVDVPKGSKKEQIVKWLEDAGAAEEDDDGVNAADVNQHDNNHTSEYETETETETDSNA